MGSSAGHDRPRAAPAPGTGAGAGWGRIAVEPFGEASIQPWKAELAIGVASTKPWAKSQPSAQPTSASSVLHALGHHAQPRFVGQVDDRADDRGVVVVVVHALTNDRSIFTSSTGSA